MNSLLSVDSPAHVPRLLVVLLLWLLYRVSSQTMTHRTKPPTESLLSQLVLDLPSLRRIYHF